MRFTKEQLERYSRHIMLDEIGLKGQEKLAEAKVLIVGAGGLGAPAALYLTAAGVGKIGVADADTVDLSNLQRQIIHTTGDLGKAKVDSAKEMMLAINPNVDVQIYGEYVCADNIHRIVAGYDFVLDCTDNFASKFLINDACVTADKPFTYAGIVRFEGQIMTVIPHRTPCMRCVFANPPQKAAVTGVVGAVAGVIGCLQALEAVKYITGAGELLTEKLLIFDALSTQFHTVKLPPRGSGCAVCTLPSTGSEPTDCDPPANGLF